MLDTITILRGLKPKLEVYHGVNIKDKALIAAATLSDRYITDRFLPDKAIDLIDEACATIKVQMESVPTELDTLTRNIMQLQIEKEALKKEKFTINELQERLRGNNVFNIGDVEYAILETSGQITVIQKPDKRTTIPADFDIMPEYEGLPYDLVIDGKIMHENLKAIGKDEIWLEREVKKFKIRPEEALVVTFDGKGQIFCRTA